MTDTEIIDWIERNPESLSISVVVKHSTRRVWYRTGCGDYDSLREAVEAMNKEYPGL